ncbi:MAG: transposase, partial [Deltaproteobacteria bacterium]|nr:transposase [Deltaproteobacteria bacterium]
MEQDFTIFHPNIVGLDVHSRQINACCLKTNEDGTSEIEQTVFGTFYTSLMELADWIQARDVNVAIMESTGIYWKLPQAVLSSRGIECIVANARAVKNAPGRKTDTSDALWLAIIGRAGLVRGSFVPPQEISTLREKCRHRQKLVSMLAAEKNRMHKVLFDAGVRLSN